MGCGLVEAEASRWGNMASSHGSASAAPAPLRKVRRESAILDLVMNRFILV